MSWRGRVVLLALLLAPRGAGAAGPATSCTICHAKPDVAAIVAEGSEVIVEHESTGAHAAVGLSCHDCHGGNPDPALADDLAAMDKNYAPAPYRGVPKRTEIPSFCGRCHSDPSFMKRYKPDARVDQELEYWTSRHGELLKTGDVKVATCIDCHGTHGIRAVANPESPVYPQRVAETCSGCHSDAKRMAGYQLASGRPLPTDQYARWRLSVHAQSLLERDDLSAPTCNDCHGNHGAVPPGVDSVVFVCGRCHGREAELFRESPKAAAFEEHRKYMKDAGKAGCPSCHPPPSPLAQLPATVTFAQCATCHENHATLRPTMAMLAPLPPTPCDFCHEAVAAGDEAVAEPAKTQKRYDEMRALLLERATSQGIDGTVRFDWLVDRALENPAHRVRGAEGAGTGNLSPEFERLFAKFRIGKTSYSFSHDGETTEVEVVRCADCHAGAATKEDPVAPETARAFIDHMRRLSTQIGRAERLQLAARRGGVDVGKVSEDIDGAVSAQIELEVLVHTFASDPDGKFMTRYREGSEHAERALVGAGAALDELGTRRRGLAVFLALLAVVAVALALKIRQLSRDS